jgi:hypothetical protein
MARCHNSQLDSHTYIVTTSVWEWRVRPTKTWSS